MTPIDKFCFLFAVHNTVAVFQQEKIFSTVIPKVII